MQDFLPMAMEFAKQHTLMVVAWFAVFFMVIYTYIKALTSQVKIIDNAKLVDLMNNRNAIVIDLRTIDEFARGHIIHSLNLLPNEIKNQNIGKIEQHKETPIILVCATGLSSGASADLLVKQGFKEVYTLKEGITGWHTANLPLVRK